MERCVKVRQVQVEQIESTYKYLQEHSSGITDEMSDGSILNQDLVKLADKIKLEQGGKLDYEMVNSE